MKIWTAVSTERETGTRCRHVFNGSYDYNDAGKEFGTKFPTHTLEVLAQGTVEMEVYDSVERSSNPVTPSGNPLNDMPAGF